MGSLPGHSRAGRVYLAPHRNPAWSPPYSSSRGSPLPWPGPHPRLPRETLAFREELDALKFLCKDVWAAVFQKQMDSLRTNHQVCGHAQRPKEPGRGLPRAGRLQQAQPGHGDLPKLGGRHGPPRGLCVILQGKPGGCRGAWQPFPASPQASQDGPQSRQKAPCGRRHLASA